MWSRRSSPRYGSAPWRYTKEANSDGADNPMRVQDRMLTWRVALSDCSVSGSRVSKHNATHVRASSEAARARNVLHESYLTE